MIPVVTIDGASGTGKGAVSLRVANILHWHLLESGALYRGLAVLAEQQQVTVEDVATLVPLAEQLDVRFVTNPNCDEHEIFLGDQVITLLIRQEEIGNLASKIASFPAVRLALLERQRQFRQLPGLVTEGRDMGTIVFPDAALKLFLTASIEIQAKRRYQQLKDKGLDVNLDDLTNALCERDKRDRERAVAPLKPAPEAIIIDTDAYSLNEVVQKVLVEVKHVYGNLVAF